MICVGLVFKKNQRDRLKQAYKTVGSQESNWNLTHMCFFLIRDGTQPSILTLQVFVSALNDLNVSEYKLTNVALAMKFTDGIIFDYQINFSQKKKIFFVKFWPRLAHFVNQVMPTILI